MDRSIKPMNKIEMKGGVRKGKMDRRRKKRRSREMRRKEMRGKGVCYEGQKMERKIEGVKC